MRSYKYFYGKRNGETRSQRDRRYNNRASTEWDVRIDIPDQEALDSILGWIKNNLNDILYILVSGIEMPDVEKGNKCPGRLSAWSEGNHVHIALVLLEPKTRMEMLRLVRGPRKTGAANSEYCGIPDRERFTYAGWIIHHTKDAFKIPGQPGVTYEYGTCPMDPVNIESALKIEAKLRQWGTDDTRKRFKVYTDLVSKNKIKERIERLQMQLEDVEEEE